MSSRRLGAAYVLALCVPFAERLWPEVALARGSLAALAVLPFFVLAPLPGRSGPLGADWREAALVGCFALPPLLLGAGLDLARGAEPIALAGACAGAWVSLLAWSAAARCAERASRARLAYAGLWLTLLPGAAALRAALVWVPERASGTGPGPALLFAVDPLVWCHRWGRPGGLEHLATGELACVVLGALLVLACVLALARPAPGGSAR